MNKNRYVCSYMLHEAAAINAAPRPASARGGTTRKNRKKRKKHFGALFVVVLPTSCSFMAGVPGVPGGGNS